MIPLSDLSKDEADKILAEIIPGTGAEAAYNLGLFQRFLRQTKHAELQRYL